VGKVRILAPIAVVMLPEALAFAALGCLAAFERKAGPEFQDEESFRFKKFNSFCILYFF